MKTILRVLPFIAALGLLAGCASTNTAPERAPLTLDNIVSQVKAGKDAQTVIADIKASGTVFDVSASQYATSWSS